MMKERALKIWSFILITVLWSCSSDKKNVPSAGFSLDSNDIRQWDLVHIIDESSGGKRVDYQIEGGRYHLHNNELRLLEPNNYKVTQTVNNSEGSDTFAVEVEVNAPDRYYSIDGNTFLLKHGATWGKVENKPDYIRIQTEIENQSDDDLIKLYQQNGNNPLEGEYIYNTNEQMGTYHMVFYKNYTGSNYDWTTNGDGGERLVIELIYKDPLNEKFNAYDITISNFTLNYGNYNFIGNKWVSLGTKNFSLHYRGMIE